MNDGMIVTDFVHDLINFLRNQFINSVDTTRYGKSNVDPTHLGLETLHHMLEFLFYTHAQNVELFFQVDPNTLLQLTASFLEIIQNFFV